MNFLMAGRLVLVTFLATSAVVASGCGSATATDHTGSVLGAGKAVEGRSGTTPAQALRTCADRWNQGNMLSWGPALATVSVRRLNKQQLAEVGLSNPAVRRCTVALAREYARPSSGCGGNSVAGHPALCVNPETFICVIDSYGAYGCPANADTAHTMLTRANAAVDNRGRLHLEVALAGTHPTPALGWQQRYPHTDGWIEPWTRSGKLRAGLVLAGAGGAVCDRGSRQTNAPSAGSCRKGPVMIDPCFAASVDWTKGTVVACPAAPGATNFRRLVIASS